MLWQAPQAAASQASQAELAWELGAVPKRHAPLRVAMISSCHSNTPSENAALSARSRTLPVPAFPCTGAAVSLRRTNQTDADSWHPYLLPRVRRSDSDTAHRNVHLNFFFSQRGRGSIKAQRCHQFELPPGSGVARWLPLSVTQALFDTNADPGQSPDTPALCQGCSWPDASFAPTTASFKRM